MQEVSDVATSLALLSQRAQLFWSTKLAPEQPILLLCRRLAPLPGVSRIGART